MRGPRAVEAQVLQRGSRPPDDLGDLGAGRHAELGEDAGEVALDGLLGEEQLATDLAVRAALGDELGDLALAAGERVEALAAAAALARAHALAEAAQLVGGFVAVALGAERRQVRLRSLQLAHRVLAATGGGQRLAGQSAAAR